MPLDTLPSGIVTFTRDEIRAQYLRDYAIRNPNGSTQAGQQPDIDASTIADTLTPVYANAVTLGNGLAVQTMTPAQLRNELLRLGSDILPAVGASGFVIAAGSAGGGTIFAGDEIKTSSGLRYTCLATAVYPPGTPVPISGFDTGPATNQPPGTTLTWTSPRPGIASTAKVAVASDGSGLTGGRDVEGVEDQRSRIVSMRANPAASGNDAEIQAAILGCPGISIQQPFTYPAILGPGTTGFTFTLRPSSPGAGRIPTSAQIDQVRAWLVGQFPKDDGFLACVITAYPIQLLLQTSWAPQAPGWADATTWPLYIAGDPVLVLGATSPTAVRLGTLGTATSTPQVGQTIAFYDQPNATFRRKKVLTVAVVSAGVSWDLTFDTTNAASDASYTPVVGQPACPWSDSLQSLVAPLVAYFDGLGPGEQVGSFFDAGYRRRRSPRAPTLWPNTITRRLLAPLYALSTVGDNDLLSPASPTATPTGSPGVNSLMMTLGSLAVFP